jgi:LuxR family maltose regulon positive regulatory protein
MRGNSRQAQFWLQRHHTFDTHAQWGHHLIGIGAHLATGLLALDRLDPLGCRAELDHLGDGSQPVELWPFVAYLHAQHGLHYGDPATTLAGLDAAQRAHHRDLGSQGAALALLARARADLLIVCGQGQRARQLLQKTDMTGNAALAVAMARIHLLAGDHAGARRIAANSLWHPSTSTRERLELSLIKAAAALRMNDHAQARRQAGQTFTLYQHTRALRVFTAISRADLEQLLDLAGCDLAPGELTRIDAATLVYPDLTLVTLTGREQYLLVALEETASRQDIAKALFVSLNTVKTQLAALYRKLGTSTREETLMRVRQLGLLG